MSNHLECSCKYAERIFADNTKVQEQCEYILNNDISVSGDKASRYTHLIKLLNYCLEQNYIPSFDVLYIACFRASTIDDKTYPLKYDIVKMLLKHGNIETFQPKYKSRDLIETTITMSKCDYKLIKILIDSGVKPHKDNINDILDMLDQDKLRMLHKGKFEEKRSWLHFSDKENLEMLEILENIKKEFLR
jgi:hypothetical protein